MKYPRKPLKGSLTALIVSTPLLLASSFVSAQDSGFYLGGSYGESYGRLSRAEVAQTFQDNGRQVLTLDKSDEDNAGKLLLGYDINQIFAAEFSYFHLGQYEFNTLLAPAQNMRGRSKVEGFGLDLVTRMPITDKLSALLRAGVARTSVAQSFSRSPSTPANSFDGRTDREFEGKAGFGLEYDFTDALSARAELDYYRLPSNQIIGDSAHMATVGLVYRFGRAAPAPAPVAPTPAPAPRPEPTPPPAPEPVNITLDASLLFDFDEATLRPAGRQELDALLRQLNDMDYDSAIVVGHTDRIGSREYNLGLSQRRADAVRSYLVQGGVPANTITARGVANDESLIAPSECRGLGSNAATIACLQPDRRVVVEIDGTREP